MKYLFIKPKLQLQWDWIKMLIIQDNNPEEISVFENMEKFMLGCSLLVQQGESPKHIVDTSFTLAGYDPVTDRDKIDTLTQIMKIYWTFGDYIESGEDVPQELR